MRRFVFPLIFLLFLTAVSCLTPGANPGAAGGAAGSPTGTNLMPPASPSGAAGPSGEKEGAGGTGGGDVASNQPGPGGSLPSGTPAPTVDYDGGWICLNGRYQRLCNEGSEKRVRIELKGKITNPLNDPTACAFDGKRALRIIYPGGLEGRGAPSSWYVDAPVAEDGKVEAVLATTDPESMRFFLVPKEQDSVTEEKSCANNVCVDSDGNGTQDGDRCAVITLRLLCDQDSPPPLIGKTLTEEQPHNQGPLGECSHYLIKKNMSMETVLSPALKK